MKRGYWHDVLASGGFTPLPRWSRSNRPVLAEVRRILPAPVADTVLLAAHVKVLAALTGDREVVTGCRTAPGATPLLIRVPVQNGTWRALMGAVAEALVTAVHNGAESLAQACVDLGRTGPLFDSAVGLGLDVDLAVAVEDGELVLRHRVDVLDGDAAGRIAGYYVTALRRLTDDPDRGHADRTLLSPAEIRHQVDDFAGPARDLPDRRFHELFEDQVRRRPDAIAAVQDAVRWTYAQLNRRANQVARELRTRGLSNEDVVAVVSERDLDWLAAAIGVFKAGGVYLPVEPHFPAARITSMLRRSGCRYVLAQKRLSFTDVVLLGDISGPDVDLGLPVAATQGAYVYFTSGSTGEPKGALCEHAGFLNHLLAMNEELGVTEGTVIAQTAPQCFDISLWQMVSALIAGGVTHVVEQEAVLDVPRFVRTLRSGRVEIVQLVPSYLEVVLAVGGDLPDLRYVSATGEALRMDLVERWFASYPGVPLVNAYGLTEVCDDTNLEIMSAVPDRGPVSLGRPLRNVHAYVVDENLDPVPLGSPGEIVFSGVCVARGYLNDHERTRASFCDDPHRPGQRLYRSGDFGHWSPDGRLEFHGRRDTQVKVRGFRIEIGDIENHLLRVPGVLAGAVVVQGEHDDSRLVGHFTGAASEEDVAAALAADLPPYLVPSRLHRRKSLPLTANGKIDRHRLAAESTSAGGQLVSAAERRLAGVWAEVLKVPLSRIGRTTNFYEIGGTSLTTIRLAVALRRLVSVEEVGRVPVLANLAHLIEQRELAARKGER